MRSTLLICFNIFVNSVLYSQGYKIEVEYSHPSNKSPTLSYYYGMKQMVLDSGAKVNDSTWVFKGDSLLKQGLYLLKQAKTRYIEILLGRDQVFTIQVDTSFTVMHCTISGAIESEIFLDYQQYIADENREKVLLRKKSILYHSYSDSLEVFNISIDNINQNIKKRWAQIIDEYPNTLLANTIKLFVLPDIPDLYLPSEVDNTDSLRWLLSLQYFSQHYLDNVVFTDERLLRIPLFQEKVFTYLTKIAVQEPDSLIVAIDTILGKANDNMEVYRFLLNHFLNYYESSTSYGADEVFIHLVDQYFLAGKAAWVDLNDQKQLDNKAARKRNTLLGQPFIIDELTDYKGKKVDLIEIRTEQIIVLFWSMDCGYCKQNITSLSERIKIIDKQTTVVAFNLDMDTVKWEEFVQKQGNNFIHINVWKRKGEIEKLVDIKTLPKYLVLDQDKKIILKPQNYRQLEKHIVN